MQNKKNNRQIIDYTTLIWSIAIGIICFAAHIFICKSTNADPAVIGLILLVFYLAAVTVLAISIYRYQQAKTAAEAEISSNSNTLRDLLAQINTSLLLTDGNGRILWYNDLMADTFSLGQSAIGTSMYTFCNLTEEKLLTDTESGGTPMIFGDKNYLITCFKVRAQVKSRDDVRDFYLTVFEDNTELTLTRDRIDLQTELRVQSAGEGVSELAREL